MNQSKYETKTNYPIWFSSHEEIGIFVRYVISPFHPTFDRQQTHTTQ